MLLRYPKGNAGYPRINFCRFRIEENTAQRVFLYTANVKINDTRHATILRCHDSDIMHCDVDSGAKLLLGDFYGNQIQARHYYRRGNTRHI